MKKILAIVYSLCMVVALGLVHIEAHAEGKLGVYSPHPPATFIDLLVKDFENTTGVTVEVVAAGTGELLKRIETEGNTPLGDVIWGGITFLA